MEPFAVRRPVSGLILNIKTAVPPVLDAYRYVPVASMLIPVGFVAGEGVRGVKRPVV